MPHLSGGPFPTASGTNPASVQYFQIIHCVLIIPQLFKTDFINSSRTRYCTTREKCGQLALTARFSLVIHAEQRNLRLRRTPKRSGSQKLPKNTMRGRRFPAGLWIIEIFQDVDGGRNRARTCDPLIKSQLGHLNQHTLRGVYGK